MKKSLLTIFALLIGFGARAADGTRGSGIWNTNIIVNGQTYSGGIDAFAVQDYNGQNLGTVTNLTIDGANLNTFKNGSSDITGATLFYRVYLQGQTPAAFQEFNLPFGENLPNSGDQRWGLLSGANINLLNGINTTTSVSDTYVVEIYWRASSNIDGNHFDNNNGNNYTATFSIAPIISVTPNSISNLVAVVGNAGTPFQINVSGQFLGSSLQIDGNSSDLEYSLSELSGYESTVVLPANSGVVSATPVFVRIVSGAAIGNVSGLIFIKTNGNLLATINASGAVSCGTSLPTVSISPASSELSGGSTTVTMSVSEPNLTIRYTTDGTAPSVSSSAYSQPFTVQDCGNTVTVRAKAFDSNGCFSDETSVLYNFFQPLIAISSGGNFASGSAQVTIVVPQGTTAYYTTDGTTPTSSSTQYSAPFTLSGSNGCSTKTVKAIAVEGSCSSDVVSSSYTFNQEGITVYFKNNLDWPANDVKMYVFYRPELQINNPVDFPGAPMTARFEGNNWYSFDLSFVSPATQASLVFNRGLNTPYDPSWQTVDVADISATGYFVPSQTVNGEGKQQGTFTTGIPAELLPATPTASVASASRIDLSWQDMANEDGYELQRATSSDFCSGVATFSVNANVTTYSDTNLSAGTTYYYRVRAKKN